MYIDYGPNIVPFENSFCDMFQNNVITNSKLTTKIPIKLPHKISKAPFKRNTTLITNYYYV